MSMFERIKASIFGPPEPPPIRGPWRGDRNGAVSQAPVMPAGSVISCPNDHWLFALTVDLERGMEMKSSEVRNIEDLMPRVTPHSPIVLECPYCGERWRRVVSTTREGSRLSIGKWQTHFTTGWWPAIPEQVIRAAKEGK